MGVKPKVASKTVTTAGTRVQLTTSALLAPSFYIEALGTNTGFIYVGDSSVSSTLYMARLSAGQGFSLSGVSEGRGIGGEISLSTIWIDSSVNGEKALWSYLDRSDSV